MILTVDIGNSNICFALHENDPKPLWFERLSTNRAKKASARSCRCTASARPISRAPSFPRSSLP